MRVLVTCRAALVSEGIVPGLVSRGHRVRLLARDAATVAREWPDTVEPFDADSLRPDGLRGAADGCEAVIHITSVGAEDPPERTFERVNVTATQHLLRAAADAGAPRFVLVSTLGAEVGRSPFHVSNRDAERLVRQYPGPWIIVRSGSVYGPGDDIISQLLTMHRTLPALPVYGAGNQPFQPIWHEDLAAVLARAIQADIAEGSYEVAGPDVTTPNDLLERFERVTARSPLRVPMPEFLVRLGATVADMAGLPVPLDDAELQRALEHGVIAEPEQNAVTRVFGVRPTPLDQGLARLVDAQPVQQPGEGFGAMERRRVWADIAGSRMNAEQLLEAFRQRATEVLPLEFEVEPGTPQEVVEGATLTTSLPMRGNIQIRIEQAEPRAITFATVRGHPLAGVVRFTTSEPSDGVVRFAVTVFARAATALDWLGLRSGGLLAQASTWETVVSRVVELSGGHTKGIDHVSGSLDDEEGAAAEQRIAELIAARRRRQRASL